MPDNLNDSPDLNPENEPKEAPVPSNEAVPVPPKRHGFPRPDEPKTRQFTARATERQANRIQEALDARRGNRPTYDIVMLSIDMLNHIEADWLQSFKTKKDE